MVLDHEDVQLVGADAIVDAEGEASHRMASQVPFDHGPEAWRRLDLGDRCVELPQEAPPRARGPRLEDLAASTTSASASGWSPARSCRRAPDALVEFGGLDHFRLSLRMVGQSHPIARRAACMTSS